MAMTPGRPDDPHQPRPALVISPNVRNRLREHVIVIPMYSQGSLGPTRVEVPAGTGGVRHGSLLFCEEVTTLDRGFLPRGPLGPPVDADVLDAAVRAVRRAIGEVIAE